jgi:DDB1- and CUL4-associated factor 12
LDDQFIVSGSKDAKMALWRISDEQYDTAEVNKESCPSYAYEAPLVVKECRSAQKVSGTLTTLLR